MICSVCLSETETATAKFFELKMGDTLLNLKTEETFNLVLCPNCSKLFDNISKFTTWKEEITNIISTMIGIYLAEEIEEEQKTKESEVQARQNELNSVIRDIASVTNLNIEV